MNRKGGTLRADRHAGVTDPGPNGKQLQPDMESTKLPLARQGMDAQCALHEAWRDRNFAGTCPVREVLDRIGDRWTVLVVLRLGAGPIRFRALLRSIDGISQRMLTVTLRALERDGLVNRTVFDTRPPAVEYKLTNLGKTLLDPLNILTEWAMTHDAEVSVSRASFDQRAKNTF